MISSLLGGQYIYSISDDGRKLVFRQRITSSNLWLAQLNEHKDDKLKTIQLTTGTSEMFEPSVSPDGKQIAFAMTIQGEVHIFTLPLEGGTPKQITHTNTSNRSPAWSPDGKTIAYTTNTIESQKIAVIDSKGGVPRLSEQSHPTNQLVWYPGERILYNDWRNCGLFDPESGTKEQLMTNDVSGYVRSPHYSPDGSRVALIVTEFEGEWHTRGRSKKELAIYSVDDHTELWTAPFDWERRLIGWSQDGEWLYLKTPDSTKTAINRIRITDGFTEPVVSLPWTDIYEIAMSPNCSTFICVRGRSQSDIWLIENFDPDIESKP